MSGKKFTDLISSVKCYFWGVTSEAELSYVSNSVVNGKEFCHTHNIKIVLTDEEKQIIAAQLEKAFRRSVESVLK